MHPSTGWDGLETVKIKGRSWLGWQTMVWTGLAALVLYGLGQGNHSLWDYHEPYVAGIVREMATSHNWVVPTLNGQPYLEKPPLFYALAALVCRATGSFDPWALRLPSALLALATVVWVSFLGWRLNSARAGTWAGFMLATSVLFFSVGHEAVVDMTLTAAVSFGLGTAFLVMIGFRRRWVPWFWVGLGLSFLAKGVVGPLMILLPLGLTLLIERDRGLLKAFLAPNWGMLAAFLLPLAWIVALYINGGTEYLVEVFIRNTFGRFLADPALVPRTGRLGEHVEPFFFYFSRTPGNVLPWLAIWVVALWSALPGRRKLPHQHMSPRAYFLPLAFAVNLLLLSISREKRMVYLLPILPITFLHAALWLDVRIPRARARIDRTLLAILGLTLLLVGILGAGFPWYLAVRGEMPKAAAAAVSLVSLALSAASLRHLWRRDHTAALNEVMLQWTAFLAVFLVVAVPSYDREAWAPLTHPYEVAQTLEKNGYTVYASCLTETQMGFSSLTLRHDLPTLNDPAKVRAALASPRPVVVLIEPLHWKAPAFREAGAAAIVVRTRTSDCRKCSDNRAPEVLVNVLPPKGLSLD
ncbi:MAG TPA: glycosyltransferase family 39 protein [Holophagaceae bacterium]|jgi:4-amino-4-deoxy-L-arabinose transferase-like glycosyltransferase|nr:glycosyltransferase family 39 protein [Holophagaceae bacterium]